MLLLTFIVAVIVSFLGYIPLGNINLTAMQLSINKNVKHAIIFISTFSVFEAFFTYIIMRFAAWFAEKESVLQLLNWVLIIVFIVLGILTWRKTKQSNPKQQNYSKAASIRTGIILGIFNPIQIPFWAIVGTYLIGHGWIVSQGIGLPLFALGSGVGAFACLYLYAHFAKFIQEKFSLSSKRINHGIAIVFFALAIISLIRQFYN
ncbi:MAG: lysine transporter LysE [Sphingobacteriales bacterium]|nr:MAG: lysine transporter LysE [Sphingobacteriales bacterium]TAF79916.1 MAG: lysine transporter LysE [Sphingobacteriales bacterium]